MDNTQADARRKHWYRWEDLDLLPRTRHALGNRCRWEPDINPLLLSDSELLRTRQFGMKSLRDLRYAQQLYEAAHPVPSPWGHPLLTEP